MSTIIDIDDASALQAHEALGGAAGDALAQAMERSRTAGSAPVWRMRATHRSIHALESVHRLANASGARIELLASPELDEQERAFFDDYLRYRLPVSPARRLREKAAELAGAGGDLLGALIRLRPGKAGPTSAIPATLDEVVIIGVYGGDHIGDSAILGGALIDLRRRYGVRRATIMSARPEHTRRLVQGLSVPVEVRVDRYTASAVERRLRGADALVLGGGPLFNSPRILARHLASAEAARRRGIPFLVERIGYGPLTKPLCLWMARRFLAMASSISVRAAPYARHPSLDGLKAEVSRDPAFDYLASRTSLDRLAARDAAELDALLQGAEGAIKIGVNLRPTRDDWLNLSDIGSPMVDPGLMARLAEGLTRFARASRRRVVYVFFPMNSIQLGMSDLSAACELKAALPADVELRVWEGDPSLDGVLRLLRGLDAAIVMRFHAAVFALSQDAPVVGVDYFPPPGGKVSQVLADAGRPQDAAQIDKVSAEWLAERLDANLAVRARPAQ
jgi:polysaccharide pyruvyl transferase WcaK-like protein